MKFRAARHTSNLPAIVNFYTNLLGFKLLGSFTGHDGYDGVFIGLPGATWHLEFTTSADAPVHRPDDDDLLVFYPETADAFDRIVKRFTQAEISSLPAKNPYWNAHGVIYADPDGYGVVLSKDQII